MSDSLAVVLDDFVAGTVTRQTGGRLRFDYEIEYQQQQQPSPTPLSLSMPLQVRSDGHQTISPWMRNLLPDDEAVLRRWGRECHVSPC